MTDKTTQQYPLRVRYSRKSHWYGNTTGTAFIADENDLLKYAQAMLGNEDTQNACGRVADERDSINSAIVDNIDDDEFVAEEKAKLAELESGGEKYPFCIFYDGAGEGSRYDFCRTGLELLEAALLHDHQSAEVEVLGEGDAAFSDNDESDDDESEECK